MEEVRIIGLDLARMCSSMSLIWRGSGSMAMPLRGQAAPAIRLHDMMPLALVRL